MSILFDLPAGGTPSIWNDMRRLQREMDSLVSSAFRSRSTDFPAVNLWTCQESAIVTAELPGVDLNDVDISVVGDTLSIRGTRRPLQLGEGETYHRRERGVGEFARVMQLPFRVEPDEVSATLKNGNLSISLPRAHADRPRKIQVRNA